MSTWEKKKFLKPSIYNPINDYFCNIASHLENMTFTFSRTSLVQRTIDSYEKIETMIKIKLTNAHMNRFTIDVSPNLN